jgi:hypothetical protein
VPRAARAEEGTALDAGSLDIFGDGLSRAEVNSFGFDVTAFDMKTQRCLITVLMEVGDPEPAAGFDARTSVKDRTSVWLGHVGPKASRQQASPQAVSRGFPRAHGSHRRDRKNRVR